MAIYMASTYELVRRLHDTGVTANCVHPGMVRGTHLGHGTVPGRDPSPEDPTASTPKTPEQVAEASVYLATSPALEAVSGRFFIDRRERQPNKATHDRALAERLWTVSGELTGQVDNLEAKMLGESSDGQRPSAKRWTRARFRTGSKDRGTAVPARCSASPGLLAPSCVHQLQRSGQS
jgi:hypothetical protein